MKINILVLFLLLAGLKSFSQTSRDKYIGLNLIQLPTSTINLSYSIDMTPFLTLVADVGYTLNYEKFKGIDFIGYNLTRHNDLYDGYALEKRSGGYIKLGGFLNLRRDFDKTRYFQVGVFVTNSLVNEKGLYYSANWMPYPVAQEIEHRVNILGLNTSLGYSINLSNRLKTNFNFQLSFLSSNFAQLYSYENFVPGMGLLGNVKGNIIPMLNLELKYLLK